MKKTHHVFQKLIDSAASKAPGTTAAHGEIEQIEAEPRLFAKDVCRTLIAERRWDNTARVDLDPGLLLWLTNVRRMSATQIETMLYGECGLLGVSEISSDMRVLLESADPRAQEAIDLFVYRIVRELGSLAAAAGGLDTTRRPMDVA